ncbi:MAG: hypothetical protein M3O22_06510 [Pseudomonadota bacterium]|nr:hypothetical protein [Pseudomonadota bacterium]
MAEGAAFDRGKKAGKDDALEELQKEMQSLRDRVGKLERLEKEIERVSAARKFWQWVSAVATAFALVLGFGTAWFFSKSRETEDTVAKAQAELTKTTENLDTANTANKNLAAELAEAKGKTATAATALAKTEAELAKEKSESKYAGWINIFQRILIRNGFIGEMTVTVKDKGVVTFTDPKAQVSENRSNRKGKHRTITSPANTPGALSADLDFSTGKISARMDNGQTLTLPFLARRGELPDGKVGTLLAGLQKVYSEAVRNSRLDAVTRGPAQMAVLEILLRQKVAVSGGIKLFQDSAGRLERVEAFDVQVPNGKGKTRNLTRISVNLLTGEMSATGSGSTEETRNTLSWYFWQKDGALVPSALFEALARHKEYGHPAALNLARMVRILSAQGVDMNGLGLTVDPVTGAVTLTDADTRKEQVFVQRRVETRKGKARTQWVKTALNPATVTLDPANGQICNGSSPAESPAKADPVCWSWKETPKIKGAMPLCRIVTDWARQKVVTGPAFAAAEAKGYAHCGTGSTFVLKIPGPK